MMFSVIILAVAHAVSCGNVGVRTSSLLSPAGVTYVDGSYHAGLAAGPVGYSSSFASAPVTSVAAAPAALAVSTHSVAAAPVAAVAASPPIAVAGPAVAAAPAIAATPVAYAAPAAKYAAIPTVQHVPAVADVPVTRINAQPGVIQKTVDLARPAVKTQRYEVRRPAIQKQFYDIEERVVVRPAGSAVVELDEPLSRTQKGPSVIQPTGGPVAVSAEAVAVPTGPAVSAVSGTPAVSAVSAALPTIEANYARSGIAATANTAAFSAPLYASHAPAIASLPIKTISVASPVQTVSVSAPIHSAPATGSVSAATVGGISSVSAGSSGITSISSAAPDVSFSTPVPQYQQQFVQSTPAPEYSDDAVSIENPEYSLARSNQVARSGYAASDISVQDHQSGGLAGAVFQPVAQQTYASPAPTAIPAAPARPTVFGSAVPLEKISVQGSASARSAYVPSYQNSLQVIPSRKFSSAPIYSEDSLQSQLNHDNQQKFIQLLTARGGITEVAYGKSGSPSYQVEAGDVRARVISATPAPAYAAPAGERVNTRRVVFSRPIETLREVEVAEPVTKYERVHVAQPTVIKTASHDVVRVPTSVPVYGKAFAPIAENSFSTLSTEWN